MGGARIFAVWGQRGGRAKSTGAGQWQQGMSLVPGDVGSLGAGPRAQVRGQLPTCPPPLAPPMYLYAFISDKLL